MCKGCQGQLVNMPYTMLRIDKVAFKKDIKRNFWGTFATFFFAGCQFLIEATENLDKAQRILNLALFFQIIFLVLSFWYLIKQNRWILTEGVKVGYRILETQTVDPNSHLCYEIEYLFKYRVKSQYYHTYFMDSKAKRFSRDPEGRERAEQYAKRVVRNHPNDALRYNPNKIFDIDYDNPYFFTHVALAFFIFYFFPSVVILIYHLVHKISSG